MSGQAYSIIESYLSCFSLIEVAALVNRFLDFSAKFWRGEFLSYYDIRFSSGYFSLEQMKNIVKLYVEYIFYVYSEKLYIKSDQLLDE
jgi:hypothetical protein